MPPGVQLDACQSRLVFEVKVGNGAGGRPSLEPEEILTGGWESDSPSDKHRLAGLRNLR